MNMSIVFLFIRLFSSIVLALFIGKIISKIKLPAIVGWLLSGMILSPFALNLMNYELLNASSYQVLLSVVDVSVGLMIGAELVLDKLKKYGRQIMITTVIQSIGTFLLVTLSFLITFYFTNIPLYTSFIFGGIALATAPAPALSIVEEFQTDGPITRTLIPIAALDDIIAFIVFFTTISIVTSGFSHEAIPLHSTLFIRILLPIIVGVAIGWLAGIFLKKETSNLQTLVITLSFILLASAFGLFLNYSVLTEPVLNFLLIGLGFSATFANMISSKRLNQIMHIFNPFLRISLVLLIFNLGATLDYRLVLSSGIFTLIYILSRGIGKYSFASLGSKITRLDPTIQKYLGLTLLPHSGTSLIFTGIVVNSLYAFDPQTTLIIQGTISAAAVLNEIIAVILSKKAFDWADETGKRNNKYN